MKTQINKCLTYFILSQLCLVLLGCSEFFMTPDRMNGEKFWLRSIEYQDTLFFKRESQVIRISHQARVSSQMYEVRLYFLGFEPPAPPPSYGTITKIFAKFSAVSKLSLLTSGRTRFWKAFPLSLQSQCQCP